MVYFFKISGISAFILFVKSLNCLDRFESKRCFNLPRHVNLSEWNRLGYVVASKKIPVLGLNL